MLNVVQNDYECIIGMFGALTCVSMNAPAIPNRKSRTGKCLECVIPYVYPHIFKNYIHVYFLPRTFGQFTSSIHKPLEIIYTKMYLLPNQTLINQASERIYGEIDISTGTSKGVIFCLLCAGVFIIHSVMRMNHIQRLRLTTVSLGQVCVSPRYRTAPLSPSLMPLTFRRQHLPPRLSCIRFRDHGVVQPQFRCLTPRSFGDKKWTTAVEYFTFQVFSVILRCTNATREVSQ